MKTLRLFLLCFVVHYSSANIILDCNFNSDSEWAVVGNAYTCHGKFIQSNYSRTVNAVTGNHTNGMTHQNVTDSSLTLTRLTLFPKDSVDSLKILSTSTFVTLQSSR